MTDEAGKDLREIMVEVRSDLKHLREEFRRVSDGAGFPRCVDHLRRIAELEKDVAVLHARIDKLKRILWGLATMNREQRPLTHEETQSIIYGLTGFGHTPGAFYGHNEFLKMEIYSGVKERPGTVYEGPAGQRGEFGGRVELQADGDGNEIAVEHVKKASSQLPEAVGAALRAGDTVEFMRDAPDGGMFVVQRRNRSGGATVLEYYRRDGEPLGRDGMETPRAVQSYRPKPKETGAWGKDRFWDFSDGEGPYFPTGI